MLAITLPALSVADGASKVWIATGLTPGSHTVKAQFAADAATSTIVQNAATDPLEYCVLTVEDLP